MDNAGRRIVTGNLTRAQAEALAAEIRAAASRLIPDQMPTYDLIYGARFRRWIGQFCPADD